MDKYSYLSNATPEYIENLYKDFKANPQSVDLDFKKFFEGFDLANQNYNGKASGFSTDELKVYNLIQAYRNRGHFIAKTNPLRPRKNRHANLELADFGLSEKDLDKKFQIGAELQMNNPSLREIISFLEARYCSSLGFEIGYVRNKEEAEFFRNKIEKSSGFNFTIDRKSTRLNSSH